MRTTVLVEFNIQIDLFSDYTSLFSLCTTFSPLSLSLLYQSPFPNRPCVSQDVMWVIATATKNPATQWPIYEAATALTTRGDVCKEIGGLSL